MRPLPRLIKWILLLSVFFLSLLSLLRFGTWLFFKSGEAPWSEIISVFWLGFRYDARVVAVFVLVILLFGSNSFVHPFHTKTGRKLWLFYCSLFSVVLLIFYVSDFLYFRYLASRLNASALGFLEDAGISARMVWQTYPVIRILLGIIACTLALGFIVKRLYKRATRSTGAPGRFTRNIWFICCFLLCALAIFGRVGQFPLRWSDAFNVGNDFEANVALNPFQSFLSSLSFRSSTFDRAKVKAFYPFMASYLGVTHPDSNTFSFKREVVKKASAVASMPNIILVICESFSGYKSSMWGNPLNTTPYFNQISKEGILFDNCFTPHFGTARGVWATITGIPDVELSKTASRNPAMVDQHTIINDFKGYEKFYFLGGSTSWANIRGLLTDNIMNLNIYEEGKYDVPKIDVWGISDKNLFLQANKVLGRQTKPFFAVIQTADNHRPYTIPQEDLKSFTPVNLPPDTLNKYGFESNEELNAFRYTDFSYKTFIEAAKKQKYFNNTIFAFVGDHGIPGNAGYFFPRSWTDNGLNSYHVPLLFYSPGMINPQRLHTLASQVDVLPTIAGLANISYTNTTLGKDLLHEDPERTGNNISFIMDHGDNAVGLIRGNYYYTRLPNGKKEDFVWANFLKSDPGVPNDSLKALYRNLTTAYFETARYMLLNNKKDR